MKTINNNYIPAIATGNKIKQYGGITTPRKLKLNQFIYETYGINKGLNDTTREHTCSSEEKNTRRLLRLQRRIMGRHGLMDYETIDIRKHEQAIKELTKEDYEELRIVLEEE